MRQIVLKNQKLLSKFAKVQVNISATPDLIGTPGLLHDDSIYQTEVPSFNQSRMVLANEANKSIMTTRRLKGTESL